MRVPLRHVLGPSILWLGLAIGLVVAGCGRHVEGSGTPDRSQITFAELREAAIPGTAHDVVRLLRPQWLQRRGSEPIRVYMNGLPFGGTAQSLSQIPASDLRYLERLTGLEGTARFGRGHAGGVIVVQTN